MRVIGTAGHVDHGKSTLVKRLTGIDPDRLAEEKKRELTIDLGFAWLTMPDGEIVGIVDVPGHRDFIENMLAGVGGIDAVLLVIAADEGVMPQTREHLAILDLLGIEHGLIVLTKTDLVDESDWLDLVEQDVQDVVYGTCLAQADIMRVSAHTGAGIDDLIAKLEMLLADLPQRPDLNQPRLPIDRVFTISGFGTVVTGTLLGGSLRVGDDIELQPANLSGRVRGLQSYKQQVEIAYPGSRVAVNVAGIDKNEVRRGDMLASRGQIKPTLLADAYFQHLPDSGRPLKHNAEVKVFTGTSEVVTRVRLLDDRELAPGQSGWIQFRLQSPTPLVRMDRFIVRYPSPPQTIGGGIIVDPHPGKRWKRFQPSVIQRLELLLEGSPSQRIAQAAESKEPIKRINLQQEVGFADAEFEDSLQSALDEGVVTEIAEGLYMATASVNAILQELTHMVTQYHQETPLRLGMPREELRSRLGIKSMTLSLLLEHHQDIISHNGIVKLRTHEITFNEQQLHQVESFMETINTQLYTPPSYKEAVDALGEDVLRALIDLGELVQVQPDIIFSRRAYNDLVAGALDMIDSEGNADVGGLRDRFNTSRKYAIGLLEHLDAVGVTRRVGDVRVRGRVDPFST